MTVRLVLLLVACVLFVLAALNVNSPRLNLVAAGLALLTVAAMLNA
jgi:hypothetical protein